MATKPNKPAKPKLDLSQIATTRGGRDITKGYIDGLPYLESSDDVLTKAGGYAGYEKLLQDDQVFACFSQRRHAVVSRPWSVTPGGNKRIDKLAAKLLEDNLNKLDWDTITDQFLYARFYGFAAAEVLWEICDNLVQVKDIRVRDRERFRFDIDYNLRLLTMQNYHGELLPERKFWYRSVGASHFDEPYGLGLGHALYWPVWFKHNGAKFWAIYLEKFASPTAAGEFPRTASEDEIENLLATLAAISQEAGVVVPEGFKISFLEATRGGGGSYESWQAYWDSAITKIILGQTMTTENGSSYSQASIHYDVRQDLVTSDADLVCESANNSWVRWLVEYNYPGAAMPRVYRDMAEEEDLNQRAERDTKLFTMGFRLTSEAVARIYGDDYELIQVEPVQDEKTTDESEKKEEPEPQDKSLGGLKKPIGFSVDFSEPEELPPLPIAPMADQMKKQSRDAWREIMTHIEGLVKSATSTAELRDSLLAAYSDLPTKKLTDVMALGLATAQLAGRHDVIQESEHG